MNISLKMAAAGILSMAFLAGGVLVVSPDASAQSKKAVKCANCGTVVTTNRKDQKSEGSATTGTVVGGVGGAVAGKVIGDSNTAAVVGGLGGAALGNIIGKNMGKKKIWSVQVKLNTGKVVDVDYDTDPEFKEGDRVRLVDGRLQRR